jgi:hypothetical protein
MDELQRARVESIVELSNDLMEAIIKNAKFHGDDPHLTHIVSAALTLTIRDLDRLAPGFTELMYNMLSNERMEK